LKDYQETLFIKCASRICCVLNLLNGFQNLAGKPASCWIEKFPGNRGKNLLDTGAQSIISEKNRSFMKKNICLPKKTESQKNI